MSEAPWWDRYREIWAVDFEFTARPGETPAPFCLVALELRSGRLIRLWEEQLKGLRAPPYGTSADCLFICYMATAEIGCHLALKWPVPESVLDLYAEFRVLTNGDPRAEGASLLHALAFFGAGGIAITEKEEMRALAIRGGPWTDHERQALLDYCESDVRALQRLFPRMGSFVHGGAALFRGKYMGALAKVEARGLPIDCRLMVLIRENREDLLKSLVLDVDSAYGVFQGTTFKTKKWEEYLAREGLFEGWPKTDTGKLSIDDSTLELMARLHPQLEPFRQLRKSMAQLKNFELPVGSDGRCRSGGQAFRSKTGRNQPKSSEFPLLQAKWLRGLVRPGVGRAIAYIDWSHQEPGIAAALSGDAAMKEAYNSGDLYLAFAKQAGAVPPNATKQSHPLERDRFKRCAIGVLYGMGAPALARSIGCTVIEAEALIREHRRVYHRFWSWLEGRQNEARFNGYVEAVLGWRMQWRSTDKPGTLMNFPMQANGAEMLRLACVLADRVGVEVIAPLHDAILIESEESRVDEQVELARACMAEASRSILQGFELRTEHEVFRHPGRFEDEGGKDMWIRVMKALGELRASKSEEFMHE